MTLPSDDIPWELLTAWLAGTLPPEDRERLDTWIVADPAHGEFVASLRMIWTGAAEVRPTWNARVALQVIKARGPEQPVLSQKVVPLPLPSSRRLVPIQWPRRALAAAAIAGLCVGGWWFVAHSRPSPASDRVASAATKRYEATRGQRLALKLPDGSGVMLGPESVLRVPGAYGRHGRVVELEGQASFEVTHDDARPFEVRTAYAVARDLGTRFVVLARRGAPSIDVTVAEGSVALGGVPTSRTTARAALADSLVLGAGDLGQVTASGRLVRQRGVSLDRYLGWTQGRLVFEAALLRDVVAELNRWYDVDIQVANSDVGALRLTATFRDQPINEVLSSIQASLGLTLSGAGRHFTFATH